MNQTVKRAAPPFLSRWVRRAAAGEAGNGRERVKSWQSDNAIGASPRPSEYLRACHPAAPSAPDTGSLPCPESYHGRRELIPVSLLAARPERKHQGHDDDSRGREEREDRLEWGK